MLLTAFNKLTVKDDELPRPVPLETSEIEFISTPQILVSFITFFIRGC